MRFERAGSQYVSVRAAGRPGTVAMSQAGFRELRRRNKRSRKGVTVHFEGAEQQQFQVNQVQQDTGAVVEGRSKRKRDQQQSLLRAAVPPEEAAQQAHREQRRATAATESNTDQVRALTGG
jgi:hypothetical protein